jgi:hypothetical protein
LIKARAGVPSVILAGFYNRNALCLYNLFGQFGRKTSEFALLPCDQALELFPANPFLTKISGKE